MTRCMHLLMWFLCVHWWRHSLDSHCILTGHWTGPNVLTHSTDPKDWDRMPVVRPTYGFLKATDNWVTSVPTKRHSYGNVRVANRSERKSTTVHGMLDSLWSSLHIWPRTFSILWDSESRHKTVHLPLSPETADLLRTLIKCYTITCAALNKYESCFVSTGRLGYKK